MLQETPPAPVEGLAFVRGARWQVVGVTAHADCEAWRLEATDGSPSAVTLLVPFDRPRMLRRNPRPRRVGRRLWMAAFRALLASATADGQLRAAAAAAIDLHPYQLDPVLACLAGSSRMLLADEVGLGKTIQAGLVISELAARGEAGRVLVVAPAGLCAQWRRELESRFHLAPLVVDAAELRNLGRWPTVEAGPWQRVALAIASVDFVKRPEVLRGMSPARYDLLVVDEAHACVHARERSAAVGWLARRSRRVLLLTATPDDGQPASFEALCGMGRLEGEPPILVFRRTRHSLGSAAGRRVHLLRVKLSPPEEALHAALERYTSRVWRARTGDPRARQARLAMVVLRKRAASGPTPLLLSLGRRLEWLSRSREDAALQLALPLGPEPDVDAEDAEPDWLLAVPGLDDTESECRMLRRLVEAGRAAAGRDSKLAALRRLLVRARQPAIVFTEYRDTLDRLAACLRAHGPLAILHGGESLAERDAAVSAFNEGRAGVLLATDAAAHGLNLQSRCRLVVNVELPWNPVRLEQRIGRVDRLGQERTVHGFNLVAAGTCEDDVLARLVARIERARNCLGSVASLVGPLNEEQVAAIVFEGESLPGNRARLGAPAPSGSGNSEAPDSLSSRSEAERLERVRCLLRGMQRPGPMADAREAEQGASLLAGLEQRAPWFTALRRGRKHGLQQGLCCICRVTAVDGRGRASDQVLVGLHVPAAEAGSIAELRPAVEAAAVAATEARVASVRSRLAAAAEALAAREKAVSAADLEPSSPLQPGLFDRRAIARAERAAAERDAAARGLTNRLCAIGEGARVDHVRAELLLVLVVPA